MALSFACLAHMEQEEAMLAATIEALCRVRAALLSGGAKELSEALQNQARTTLAADELRVRRTRLRQELAGALQLPGETVTLQMLANCLPAEPGKRLSDFRQRLSKMTAEADRLNRANAALVRHSLDFFQRLLATITGTGPSGAAYGPTGRRHEMLSQSILEGRG